MICNYITYLGCSRDMGESCEGVDRGARGFGISVVGCLVIYLFLLTTVSRLVASARDAGRGLISSML